ncbi:hypothetical protein XAP412_1410020 [Xanthomonas phaseoli pv. phaseoli]|uniref:Uncharacterized protein n=1 Tax=Xanthomonas campestris pv. phaseoli TaxID=317013 RepID=A0AB38E2X2_XANCH|nr:hypothetical protein XAP412_1410020 [Xanthomonas phaseoli pv. phaseoli]SON85255.1 hypothetical protein XAP6984_640002 [Xanthomonas phaseoli pv. phaseoli]SON91624.1 hypothetical protein XAP7430_610002 [Xanthomonas phaseoli pv. phaseoli]
MHLPSPSGTLSSFMGEKVPEGRMRVWYQAVGGAVLSDLVFFGGGVGQSFHALAGASHFFFACAKKK